MIRKIEVDKIVEISENIDKYIKELVDARQNLLNDSKLIKNAYRGVDASLIEKKYLERVNTLNKVIMNYFDYVSYLKKITGVYKDNINTVRKKIMSAFESDSLEQGNFYALDFNNAQDEENLKEV